MSGRLKPRVVDFILSFFREGGDLDCLLGRPLAGVEAVERREEAEAVGGAHGLLQVSRLVHELLNGVVAFHGAALDHLQRKKKQLVMFRLLLIC